MTEQPPSGKTAAQERVEAVLAELVAVGTPYRSATLVLTYRRHDSDEIVSFAHGTAIRLPELNRQETMLRDSGTLDLAMLPRFLRAMADKLELVVQGKQALDDDTGVTEMDGEKGMP